MRKLIKNEMMLLSNMLVEVQNEIKKYIKDKNGTMVIQLLIVNQEAIDKIIEVVNESNDMSEQLYQYLDGYCEVLFDISQKIESEDYDEANRIIKKLSNIQIQIENYIKNNIQVRKEVVFLPYNASMWDSLESIWKAANEDESCDAYVIPIPFYEKNIDGSFAVEHYEGDLFPAYVPITHYNEYDFEKNQPDTIFIHNPYDDSNIITSVHPFFFSDNLKKFTSNLIYVPYFVLSEINIDDPQEIEKNKHFCLTKGVFNADKVIVQSENIKKLYIDVLTEYVGEGSRRIWESRILDLGSPKFDIIEKPEDEIPKDWINIVTKEDGTKKTTVFFNTSINGILKFNDKYLYKMIDVFEFFKENKEEYTLLWRPHPLMNQTLKSMRPHLLEAYQQITNSYIAGKYGIYDDSTKLDRSIVFSDIYYGDASSVVELFTKRGKPVMLQYIE